MNTSKNYSEYENKVSEKAFNNREEFDNFFFEKSFQRKLRNLINKKIKSFKSNEEVDEVINDIYIHFCSLTKKNYYRYEKITYENDEKLIAYFLRTINHYFVNKHRSKEPINSYTNFKEEINEIFSYNNIIEDYGIEKIFDIFLQNYKKPEVYKEIIWLIYEWYTTSQIQKTTGVKSPNARIFRIKVDFANYLKTNFPNIYNEYEYMISETIKNKLI